MKIVPFIDRSELVHHTTQTVLHNLTEGIILVVIILLLFLGNVRGAIIVALTIPFSLLFAASCLKLKGIPGEPALAGRSGFRHGGGRRGGDGGKHRPAPEPPGTDEGRTPKQKIFDAAHEVQRPGLLCASASSSRRTCRFLRCRRVEGRLFKPMAWTVAFALLGALPVLHAGGAGAGQFLLPEGHARVAQPGDDVAHRQVSRDSAMGHPIALAHGGRRMWPAWAWRSI